MTGQHSLRVRLYGGRSVHAARELPISGGTETACEYFIDVLAANHWLDDDTEITCRRCIHAINREAQR
ncbi:hypothetical protein [Streptomyces sp. NPDC006784]|uniref:hypothetical protein n=1 Tax=Streptomyces sp. NPDC006784 TaxID=3364764 RepID=UPI0036ACB823